MAVLDICPESTGLANEVETTKNIMVTANLMQKVTIDCLDSYFCNWQTTKNIMDDPNICMLGKVPVNRIVTFRFWKIYVTFRFLIFQNTANTQKSYRFYISQLPTSVYHQINRYSVLERVTWRFLVFVRHLMVQNNETTDRDRDRGWAPSTVFAELG